MKSCCSTNSDPPEKKTTPPGKNKTYRPIIAIFSVSFLMALSTAYALSGSFPIIRILELFIAFSMCVLGIQKLQNLTSFTTGFAQYDLLAKKDLRYAYLYPFIETGAGILMIAGFFTWIAAPAALFVASVGAISVYKAIYLEKRDLQCACTGGDDGVPLGFISLLENLMMIAMSIWMMTKAIVF